MPGAIGNAQGIDLNSASEQELSEIGGIGAQRARRLVENRPFQSWDDVKRVEGFSDKLVEDLREAGATLGKEGSRSEGKGGDGGRGDGGTGERGDQGERGRSEGRAAKGKE